ncbi:MAG: type VI secretion system protein TssA [Massilia sp.]
MFSIDQLLAPISDASPCGEDLAFSSELDAIGKARQADDPSIEQGAWVTTLKEADFKFVAARCAKLIETNSKDLRLAVWLAEASAKTGGLRPLGDSLMLIAGLCDRYWEQMYPLPDEDSVEQRVGNLCWIAARVPALVHAVALTEGAGNAYSFNDFTSARTRPADAEPGPDLDAAKRRSSGKFYQSLMDDARYCGEALAELERVIDLRLGADGPGFSVARDALQDVSFFVAPLLPQADAPAVDAVAASESPAAKPAPAATGPIQSRAQALTQLRLVAEFFRRTEPHSPVAYLADKVAGWGEQTLDVWLRGVVKDPAAIAQLEELLGLQTG